MAATINSTRCINAFADLLERIHFFDPCSVLFPLESPCKQVYRQPRHVGVARVAYPRFVRGSLQFTVVFFFCICDKSLITMDIGS